MKNLILPIADRGGCGKTTCLVLIADYLKSKDIKIAPVDCDTGNRGKATSFGNYFNGKAVHLDLRRQKDCDRLLELSVASAADFILADLPANSLRDLRSWFEEVADAEFIHGMGIRMTGVAPIIAEPGAAKAIFDWMSLMGDRADYLACLNRRTYDPAPTPKEEEFSDWFQIETDGLQVATVEVPHLPDFVMHTLMETRALPCWITKELSAINKKRLLTWTSKVHAQLEAANTFNISKS